MSASIINWKAIKANVVEFLCCILMVSDKRQEHLDCEFIKNAFKYVLFSAGHRKQRKEHIAGIK